MSNQSDSEKQGSICAENADIHEHSVFEKSGNEEPEIFDPEFSEPPDEEGKEEEPVVLPNIPESVFAALPEFLKRAVSVADTKEERDILLLGSLTVLGACMPHVYGIYDGCTVHPNLYLFVTAPASGGKGRLNWCKGLVNPVHWALQKESKQLKVEHGNKMRAYLFEKKKNQDIEIPRITPEKMLFIPANSSATGVFKLLNDNEGKGIIFETEGDTLSLTFKTKHGNFSDGYRKFFHHECISYYRKTDLEYVDIESPQVSSVLAGTFDQIASLIPSAENGLFSRFIFYYMNMNFVWKDVFSSDGCVDIDKHFASLGNEYFKLYEALNKCETLKFSFTERQEEEFHLFFSQLQEKYLVFHGTEYMATVRRLGLISFRIAMILNTLRILETGDFSRKQKCLDVDFYASLDMIKVLVRHASFVYTNLQGKVRTIKKVHKKEQFLEKLPKEFNHREYITIAKELGIKERSADGYMAHFCMVNLIKKEQRDKYIRA